MNASQPSASFESLIVQIADEYTERRQRGENPDIEEFVQRYPEHAVAIRQILCSLEMIGLSSAADEDKPTADSTLPVPNRLGDFQILREVGRGGMGVVYEAEQASLGRRVALKILPFAAAIDPRQLQRFKNEAYAAAQLHHTNIVPVFGVGCERGVHYYAMQFIEGATLSSFIAQRRQLAAAGKRPAAGDSVDAVSTSDIGNHANHAGSAKTEPFPLAGAAVTTPRPTAAAQSTQRSSHDPAYYRLVATLGIQTAEALEHAHRLGIVHRDIKPGNLMLDLKGNLWITDFGLAQLQGDSRLTVTGDRIGTLRYMSPEQAAGHRELIDHHTDIYSLGVTMYELLALEPPFTAEHQPQLLRQVLEQEPRPLRNVDRAVPPELETIVLKAMAKNPRDRYATAQEFADDLRRFLEDRPILAKRPSLATKVKKWARRHRQLVWTISGAAVVCLMIVAAVSMVDYFRLSDALAKAELNFAKAKEEKDRADKQAEAAKAAEADMKAFAQFLVNEVMSAPRPKGVQSGLGTDVTMTEALTAAAKSIKRIFKDRPRAEAEARHALGVTWRNLGDYKAAEEELRIAIELRKEHLGPDHDDTLSSMNSLAVTLADNGKPKDAIVLLEHIRDQQMDRYGWDHALTLHTLQNLARTYQKAGRLTESVQLFEKVLKHERSLYGHQSPNVLSTITGLAVAYQEQGNEEKAIELLDGVYQAYEKRNASDSEAALANLESLAVAYSNSGMPNKAIEILEQVSDKMQSTHGPEHPFTLTALHNLGVAYLWAGKITKAIQLLEQVRDVELATYRPNHPSTLGTLTVLGDALRKAGRLPEAIKLLEQVRDVQLATKDAAFHPNITTTLSYLATAYRQSGRLPEAIQLFEKVRDDLIAQHGTDHPDTLTAMNNLALAYQHIQRLPEAIKLFEQVYAAQQAADGSNHPRTLTTASNLSMAYLEAKQVKKAIELADQVLKARLARFGEGHHDTLIAMNNLAWAYWNANQADKSLPLLQKAAAGVEKLAFVHEFADKIIGNLTGLYDRKGQFKYSEPWRRKWSTVLKQRFGAQSELYERELGLLGYGLLQQKKWAEAEPILVKCLTNAQKRAPDHWLTFYYLSMLGESLAGQQRYREAEPLLLRGFNGMLARSKSIPVQVRTSRLGMAVWRIVGLYEAMGKKEEAAKWRASIRVQDARTGKVIQQGP